MENPWPLALLVLCLSRLRFVDPALKCTQCYIRLPGHACSKPVPAPCILNYGQSCFRQTVYFGRTPLYSKLGCVGGCVMIKEKKEKLKLTETVFCCSNENYCNA